MFYFGDDFYVIGWCEGGEGVFCGRMCECLFFDIG